jgi:hypothetical protein
MKEVVDACLQENDWALDYWRHTEKCCVLCPASGVESCFMWVLKMQSFARTCSTCHIGLRLWNLWQLIIIVCWCYTGWILNRDLWWFCWWYYHCY